MKNRLVMAGEKLRRRSAGSDGLNMFLKARHHAMEKIDDHSISFLTVAKVQANGSRFPDTVFSALGNGGMQRLFASRTIQPKLKIGEPNDVYEQEADRISDQVMRMPEPGIQRKPG